MANNYESLKTDGHYTMARRIFTKIKGWIQGKNYVTYGSLTVMAPMVGIPNFFTLGVLHDNGTNDDLMTFEEGENVVFTYIYSSGNVTGVTLSSADEKVAQTATTTDAEYEILFSGTADNTTRTEGARKDDGIKYNPNKDAITIGTRKTNTTTGSKSFSSGTSITASGTNSHGEGSSTVASGYASHAEGSLSEASYDSAHAEGYRTVANGNYSHSEGNVTAASGESAHAEGMGSVATGDNSHAEGTKTTANHKSQHVFGEYNTLDSSSAASTARGNYVEIVGNGTGAMTRSNARTLDWDGNETIAGNHYDVNGKLAHKPLTEDQYMALSQAEQLDGTEYFVRDRVPLQICDYIYPIGAIYMSVTNVSPAILFGGTWERIEDRFLLAAGQTYNVGATGGEAEHTLITDEIPAHTHGNKSLTGTMNPLAWAGSASESGIVSGRQNHTDRVGNSGSNWGDRIYTINASHEHDSVGLGYAHNNMPPYLVVNVWMRVPDPVEEEEEE